MWMTCGESAGLSTSWCAPVAGSLGGRAGRHGYAWGVLRCSVRAARRCWCCDGCCWRVCRPLLVRRRPRLPVSLGVAANGFVLPVAPPPLVLTAFRPPADRYGAGHRGVDLAAQPGSAVVAAGTGRVVFAGALAGRGVVSIEHAGGLRTTYEPVTASVSAGATVAAGSADRRTGAGAPRLRTGQLPALGRPPAGPDVPGPDVIARTVAGPTAALGRSLTAGRCWAVSANEGA